LLQSVYFKFPTDWSRDGRYIIYRQIDPTTRYDLWAPITSGASFNVPDDLPAFRAATRLLSESG